MFNRTKPAILSILKYRKVNTKKNRQRKIDYNDIDVAEGILGKEIPFKIYQSKMKTFSSKGIYTSKVKSIKFHSKEKGYDLNTPKYHNFILGNGTLSHNSTEAMQIGQYVAWLLAGGRIKCHQEQVEGKWRWIIDYVVKPKRKIKFNLQENVAFSSDELQEKAFKLHDKYGKNQVIVYDEGRQGLDSARAMEAINKGMEDFIQACGFMGHVVIIVLPNYFKLHEDYAIARSWFLIDVYSDKQHRRGYFSFYNEEQKERLFYFGKKRIGIRAKYTSASENFWGKFSSWFPFDREEYDKLKKESIKKIRKSRQQQKWKKQRDAAIYLIKKYSGMTSVEIANELSVYSRIKISDSKIRYAISNISKQNVKEID